MSARRIEITLSQERWEQLEAARGHEPRAAFIKRAVEAALAPTTTSTTGGYVTRVEEHRPSKPSRVPSVKTARELAMERQAKLNEAKS